MIEAFRLVRFSQHFSEQLLLRAVSRMENTILEQDNQQEHRMRTQHFNYRPQPSKICNLSQDNSSSEYHRKKCTKPKTCKYFKQYLHMSSCPNLTIDFVSTLIVERYPKRVCPTDLSHLHCVDCTMQKPRA